MSLDLLSTKAPSFLVCIFLNTSNGVGGGGGGGGGGAFQFLFLQKLISSNKMMRKCYLKKYS